jgi:hypothetical protein
MPRPLRKSCDRCHSQKLKCPKQPGNVICARCARAGALCVFSPAGPSARRVLATPTDEDEIPFPQDVDNLHLALDWTSMGLVGPLGASPQTQTPPPRAPQDLLVATDPGSVCAHQLSALALDIDHTYRLVQPGPGIHISKDEPLVDGPTQWAVRYSQRQCLEQLFTWSQRLVDLYPAGLDTAFKQQVDTQQCCVPNCVHHDRLPEGLEDEIGGLVRSAHEPKLLDPFVLNLLLTCHSRVMDVFDQLLLHVTTCAKLSFTTPEFQETQLHIPVLKVGDFIASPEASSSMQAALLIHMASILLDRAKQLLEKINDAFKGDSSTKQASMFKLQCEALVEASESKVFALQKVRDRLVKVGYMR